MPATLNIRAIPRSSRNEIAGERDGRLLVRVTAPPVDGKANAAVCAVVAQAAGVAKGRVSVLRGVSSRDKVLAVEGVGDAELRAALGLQNRASMQTNRLRFMLARLLPMGSAR